MLKIDDLRQKMGFNRSQIAPALQAAGQDKLAEKIAQCATVTEIATCQGCGTKYYAGSGYCKSRFCSICAKLRAMAWLAKLVPLLKEYVGRGYVVFMLNLTLKDQSDLERGLTALSDAWRYMTNGEKTSRAKFKQLNSGGVRSTEVKIGKRSGLWHPHIHAIVLYNLKRGGKVRQFEDYRDLWERAVRSALNCAADAPKLSGVDIRAVKDYTGENSLLSAVVETFKYIAKFDWIEIAPERVNELVTKTKGKHFISAWGVLYGLNKQVEELLNRSTEEELKQHVCTVCGCSEFELEHALTDIIPKSYLLDFPK